MVFLNGLIKNIPNVITIERNIANNDNNKWEEVANKFNPLSANFTKWSNTLKQSVGKLLTTCLSVFDDFVGLVLKELRYRVIL